MTTVTAIVAVDSQWGIGKDNSMPWPRLATDLRRFKELTTGGTVVMGSNTWLSLPVRPLPNRTNVVVTNSIDDSQAIAMSGDPNSIITELKKSSEPIWIIGGSQIYRQFLQYCDKVCVTRIHGDYDCSVYFPYAGLDCLIETGPEFVDNGVALHYETWSTKRVGQ